MSIERIECDVTVVGAGPAGLAAAETAARSGACVVVVDLFSKAGGQYLMQPPSWLPKLHASDQAKAGRALAMRCKAAGVRFVRDAEVFWAEPAFRLLASRPSNAVRIESKTLVAATGATERVIPFKGWTLPGVISAGAAQRLVKTGGVSIGQRIVLAGSGPFLLAVASTFAASGTRLVAYVEAAAPFSNALRLLARHPNRAGEACKLGIGLLNTGGRWMRGHAVIEALGQNRVEAVRVAALRSDGTISPKTRIIDDIDALCIGHGFKPSIELTSVLGAEHVYDEALGGWFCRTDAAGATDVPGLYAAGEATGIGGAIVAGLSGILAGTQAAEALGFKRPSDIDLDATSDALRDARNFAAGLAALFPFPSGMLDSMPAGEVVCRCEDVTAGDIRAALDQGATDAFGVKAWTRAGMGPCQGRVCGPTLTALLSRTLNIPAADVGFNRPHLPLRPVTLETAAAALEYE